MKIPRARIEWLVSRMHVGDSSRAVIRMLHIRMANNHQWTKRRRKVVYRHALKCHERNRQLYRKVTRGML